MRRGVPPFAGVARLSLLVWGDKLASPRGPFSQGRELKNPIGEAENRKRVRPEESWEYRRSLLT